MVLLFLCLSGQLKVLNVRMATIRAGPHPWAIENFAMVAKHPSAQIIAQDLFTFGAIKSAMDFQVYKEVAWSSWLDFAYLDNNCIYHEGNGCISKRRQTSAIFLTFCNLIPDDYEATQDSTLAMGLSLPFLISGMFIRMAGLIISGLD
ncbi:Endoplasmic reticulum metallopeptidase 1 [Camellia lanceoleosa]|uniref:Endoplasmic reticulum metallopeptidase 1 n=1 Tax=Camellia lanceoleosa TaxID=1840588 RepID=A0ACC0FKI0_9ERIC|nr:Endoplasmic reticulum metallopeptidase 1 [Camellia lanceoleosa]